MTRKTFSFFGKFCSSDTSKNASNKPMISPDRVSKLKMDRAKKRLKKVQKKLDKPVLP